MSQRMVVLGAGTALPDRDRDNTFLAWDTGAGSILVDCGGRAYQQLLRADLDPRRLRAMILTHNHPDHIYGVPALVFHLWLAGYTETLPIYGNASTIAMARNLVGALELEQAGHMCAVAWNVLPEAPNTPVLETDAVTIDATPVRHSRPTLALRFRDRASGRALVYSSDTEPCPELEQLAQGAHTLIHEATANDPAQRHTHTLPREAGTIAAHCGVERLVLIHYSAEYTMPEAEALQQVRDGGFEGPAELARELAAYAI